MEKIIKTEEVLGQTMNIYGTIESPLFVAADIASWIEHSNPTEMLRSLDDDEKLTSVILRAGQNRQVQMVTEYGLYEILMLSRKPVAQIFKRGVKKVLSELRRHGFTASPDKLEEMINNPDLVIGLATQLKEERKKRALAEKHVEVMAPRYNYVQEFFEANGTMSIGEMAKNLGIKPNTMFRMLRDDGYLMIRASDRNIAKQSYIDAGYFEIKITIKNGNQFRQTRVTPRGHAYFAKKYNLFPLTLVSPI